MSGGKHMKTFQESNNIEYKRSWRDEWLKWLCAFANAQGGKLYVGIDEKSRKVVGVENPQRLIEDVPNKVIASMGIMPKFEIEERDGKQVVVITVCPAAYPVSYHGEFHVRVGATKQLLTGPALTQFVLDKTGRKWDGVPLDGVAVSDLDKRSFDIFRRRALESGRMSKDDLEVSNEQLLEKLKLMVDGKLTRAAVLLFHPDPEKWVATCYSKIGKFANDSDLLFDDEIHGSLMYQAEELVETLFLKYLIAPISYHDMTRVETYPYSKDAVREIVRNALMHQDFISGMPVQLSVHPERLYLANAGGLPSGWSVRHLFQKHGSEARNGLIANTFYRGGFVETWGRGIDKVCRECERLGVSKPKYEVTASDVMVSIEALITQPELQLAGTKSGTQSGTKSVTSQPFLSLYDQLLVACAEPRSARDLMKIAGRSNLTKFRQSVLSIMLADQVLELTIPDTPNSRLQKYRVTEKGRMALPDKSGVRAPVNTRNATHVREHVREHVCAQVQLLIDNLSGEMTARELREAVGVKNRANFTVRYLLRALDGSLIERVEAGVRSPNQKYRLTAKGRTLRTR